MILILISATVLTQSRFNDSAVVEQGSRGQPVVMHQPEEVLTSRDGSVGPDAIRITNHFAMADGGIGQ